VCDFDSYDVIREQVEFLGKQLAVEQQRVAEQRELLRQAEVEDEKRRMEVMIKVKTIAMQQKQLEEEIETIIYLQRVGRVYMDKKKLANLGKKKKKNKKATPKK